MGSNYFFLEYGQEATFLKMNAKISGGLTDNVTYKSRFHQL